MKSNRKPYHATVKQIYSFNWVYHIELDNIRQFQPYIQILDVSKIVVPASRYQQVTDLCLELGDRFEFVARYSDRTKPKLNAPSTFRKLPPPATIENLVRTPPSDISYDFYYH